MQMCVCAYMCVRVRAPLGVPTLSMVIGSPEEGGIVMKPQAVELVRFAVTV